MTEIPARYVLTPAPPVTVEEIDGLAQTLDGLRTDMEALRQAVTDLAARLDQPQPEPKPEPDPDPEPEPSGGTTIYTSASTAVMGGHTYVEAWRAHHERDDLPTGTQDWATGLFAYWPGDVGPLGADWAALLDARPDGVPVLASPKGRPDTPAGSKALDTFCTALPPAWTARFTWAYWQEPGNDFGGPGQPGLAEYRARVAATAAVVRPHGCENAVHLEEWDINPYNTRTGSDFDERAAHLAGFVTGIEDSIDAVSWSLYPAEGKSMVPGLQRIETWMDAHLPGVPWMLTAASSPVAVGRPLDAPQRVRRAEIVREAGEHILARHTATNGRCRLAFGWFHFAAFGGNTKDNLATTDPLLHAALEHVASLGTA